MENRPVFGLFGLGTSGAGSFVVVDCVDFDDCFGVVRDKLVQRNHVCFVPLEHALDVLVVDSYHKDHGERSQKTKSATNCEIRKHAQVSWQCQPGIKTTTEQHVPMLFTEHAQNGPKVSYPSYIEFSC